MIIHRDRYKLNGELKWQGEEGSDKGFIYIDNNRVFVNERPTVLDKIVEATSKKAKRAAKKR